MSKSLRFPLLAAILFLISIPPQIFTQNLRNPNIQPLLQSPTSSLTQGQGQGSTTLVVSFKVGIGDVLTQLANRNFPSRAQRISALVSALKAHAELTQKAVLDFLALQPLVRATTLWITNEILVRGVGNLATLVESLLAFDIVAEVRKEIKFPLPEPQPEPPQPPPSSSGEVEWNIERIQAPLAWELTNSRQSGSNIIVSSIDSGVRHTHEALRDSFIGMYGWYDPYTRTSTPFDPTGHGTHVMGLITGSHGIGVAPGFKWLTCRGCDAISCEEGAVKSCGQFILCPHLPNGGSPDCRKAPHIVNNSWNSGAIGRKWFNTILRLWEFASITPIFSSGNLGPQCESALYPGDQSNVITAGSTTRTDGLSPSSSRGPTDEGLVKPDFAVPGTRIRSASNNSDSEYVIRSGSSMAAPHISGVIAIMLGQDASLTFPQIKEILRSGVDQQLEGNQGNCGGVEDSTFPNNAYGYGRINAFKSLKSQLRVE